MKILFASPEGVPFSKTGGLADVIGALPKALDRNHVKVKVVLPCYKSTYSEYGHLMKEVAVFNVKMGWRNREARVYLLKEGSMDYFFIKGEDYFERDCLYGYGDDIERFVFFSLAVLEFLGRIDFTPDILHLSEWQTGLIPVLLKGRYRDKEGYKDLLSVFTIHNLCYQGIMDKDRGKDLFDIQKEERELLEKDGMLNFMKGAILASEGVNTVSPTYAVEIMREKEGLGLEKVLRSVSHKFSGILNGVDYDYYNPVTDDLIFSKYGINDLWGKSVCKAGLQKDMGFKEDSNIPLIGMVTRLAEHKGIDLVKEAMEDLMKKDLQMVILGSGDSDSEDFFTQAAKKHRGKLSFINGFSDTMARRVYSGVDLFLMPSESEPCGLSQMIALKYGAVPIVRKTGGLADTIFPFDGNKGNGFMFKDINKEAMVRAVFEAMECFEDKGKFLKVVHNGMSCDYSWEKGAARYYLLYEKLIKDWEKERLDIPSFMREGVMYQIFPDRFKRGGKGFEKCDDERRILREDWAGEPHKGPHADKSWNREFFGGNLKGIIEELDYLKELSVTAIYLNPIFESPSNHRYDTSDYKSIDPLLGDIEDFRTLIKECKKRNIGVILDGVFNHTGSDSIYFNKEGRYKEEGAYQSKNSKYYPWYDFTEYPDTYSCWWGIKTLPQVRETEESYLNFICRDKDSVIRTWMREGILGFRLDVADELPDEFLDELSRTLKEEREDGLILGEVWEDASTKVAYGKRRKYFKRKQLNSVMNYPLRGELVSFLKGDKEAEELNEVIDKIYENYPKDVFSQLMNILGTHDTERIITYLAKEGEDKDSTRKRLRLMLIIWAFMPGIPSIYYGDELGYEGGREPYNRRCFVKDKTDAKVYNAFKEILDFRASVDDLWELEYAPYIAKKDVFGFLRRNSAKVLAVIVNRVGKAEIPLPLQGDSDYLLTIGDVFIENEKIVLGELSGAVLLFNKEEDIK